MGTELEFKFFDCDNHYYGKTRLLVGGTVNRFIPNKDLRNFGYTPEQCRAVMRDDGLSLATRCPA